MIFFNGSISKKQHGHSISLLSSAVTSESKKDTGYFIEELAFILYEKLKLTGRIVFIIEFDNAYYAVFIDEKKGVIEDTLVYKKEAGFSYEDLKLLFEDYGEKNTVLVKIQDKKAIINDSEIDIKSLNLKYFVSTHKKHFIGIKKYLGVFFLLSVVSTLTFWAYPKYKDRFFKEAITLNKEVKEKFKKISIKESKLKKQLKRIKQSKRYDTKESVLSNKRKFRKILKKF